MRESIGPEDVGSTIYRNFGDFSPCHTALYPSRLERLLRLLWETQLSRQWSFSIKSVNELKKNSLYQAEVTQRIRTLLRTWRSVDRASWYILMMKPTRCTNFSNLFLEWDSTCFGQLLCPSSGVFHCTHSNGIYHTGYSHSLRAGSGRFRPDPACKLSANLYDIYHCSVYIEKTADDGQRNCPKHVEFYSKNKFEKLVHLVGFIISILLRTFEDSPRI